MIPIQSVILKKNTASQKLVVFAYTTGQTPYAPATDDAENISASISKDGAAGVPTNDVAPTEIDADNLPGFYAFDLTQAETNADVISVYAVSSTTANRVAPVIAYTSTSESLDAAAVRAAIGMAAADMDTQLSNLSDDVAAIQVDVDAVGTPADLWTYADRTLTKRAISTAPDAQIMRRQLVRGNDYGASARPFLITITDGAPWPDDLSDYTWTVEFERHEDNKADAADDHLSATASVVTPTGDSRALQLECLAAVTQNAWGLYRYSIRGTTLGGLVWDIELGEAEVVDSPAEYG